MIRVLLADGQPLVRECLRLALELEPDLRVVGEAGDGAAALALAHACCPDVVIMDLAMPGLDGLAATAALHAALPTTAVIVHTLRDDRPTRARARAAGAAAFVGKHGQDGPLVEAIRAAVRREA